MPDGVTVHGPDGKTYQFPTGTTKDAAVAYFKKKGIGVSKPKSEPLQPSTMGARPALFERMKSSAARMFGPYPGQGAQNIPEEIGNLTSGIENYTPEGRKEHPVLSRIGDATKAGKQYADLLATTLGITGGAGILGPEAEVMQGEKLAVQKETQMQKINKVLGVARDQIYPGKMPASLDEFAVNPARGVLRAGLDESKLSKMNALERNSAIMKAKDSAGKALGSVLEQAGKDGKTVDVYATITKAFSKLDPAEIKKTEAMLQEIFQKQGIDIGQLDKLSPMQANQLKQALWDEGAVGKEIYRGIAESLKKAVPEAKDALRDYADLSGAAKAAQRGAKMFAKEAPESQLRKYLLKRILPRVAEGAGIGGTGYGLFRLLGGKGGSNTVKLW